MAKMNEKRVLIFCPNIDGHRQMYSCVIANWFISKNFSVILAVGRTYNGELAVETSLINSLSKYPQIIIQDLNDTHDLNWNKGGWVDVLNKIEYNYLPEWTVFPAGDEMRDSLSVLKDRGKSGPRKSKRAVIFIKMNHYYQPDYSSKGLIQRIKFYYNWQKWKFKENDYFKKEIWNNHGIDMALTTNPDFFHETKIPQFHYFPDIYRTWDFSLTGEQEQAINNLCMRYRSFLSGHAGKEVLLYHGSLSARKGYDKLLYLATQEPETLFVAYAWPSSESDRPFCYDVDKMRVELKRQNRIFEASLPFLPDNAFFDLLYSSCNFMLLPYDNFYALSGIMIRATAFGKPILVPSIGYLASMVKKFRMGLTYRNNDYEDFRRKFQKLRGSFLKYSENAKRYGREFDKEKVYAALEDAFLNG